MANIAVGKSGFDLSGIPSTVLIAELRQRRNEGFDNLMEMWATKLAAQIQVTGPNDSMLSQKIADTTNANMPDLLESAPKVFSRLEGIILLNHEIEKKVNTRETETVK